MHPKGSVKKNMFYQCHLDNNTLKKISVSLFLPLFLIENNVFIELRPYAVNSKETQCFIFLFYQVQFKIVAEKIYSFTSMNASWSISTIVFRK